MRDKQSLLHDFAKWQSEARVNLVSIQHDGQAIINPWYDPSGRFPLNNQQSLQMYGESLVAE